MTPELTQDQRQAIEEKGGKPVYLVDADTHATYVLLRADQYETVKPLFEPEEKDFDPREGYPFVDEVMQADDASDPALEKYQSFSSPQT